MVMYGDGRRDTGENAIRITTREMDIIVDTGV